MAGKDREGNLVAENDSQEKVLKALYETTAGRAALRVLVSPEVSRLGGAFLESRLSAPLITPFIRKSHIDMDEYEDEEYDSYNQFFCRRIKEGERSFSKEANSLCAPCDSRLTVYPIAGEGFFRIKNTLYNMESLLRSKKLAKKYFGGTLCVFRLTVEDYHHYCYVDDGKKSRNFHIPGVFHTVNPTANEQYPIYTENTREFSILRSKHFGDILMMEVGAMLVGRIVNHHEEKDVVRGMEKGFFEFGGSTVILAFEQGRVSIAPDILKNSKEGYETVVKLGERIGETGEK